LTAGNSTDAAANGERSPLRAVNAADPGPLTGLPTLGTVLEEEDCMNISLPDVLVPWIEQKATQAGFETAEAYVLQILRTELEREGRPGAFDTLLREAMTDGVQSPVTPEDLSKRQREIDEHLLEGLDSGSPAEVGEDFWQERRRVLQERIATRGKAAGP